MKSQISEIYIYIDLVFVAVPSGSLLFFGLVLVKFFGGGSILLHTLERSAVLVYLVVCYGGRSFWGSTQ